jgi:diguanylate cyclase (GGDEF)-like protein/PAS domain S-box-containing protein
VFDDLQCFIRQFFGLAEEVTEMTALPDNNLPFSIAGNTEKHYRLLFEQSPIASLLVNRAGRIVEFNRRAADLLLINPESRSNPDLTGFISPEYQIALTNHLNAVYDDNAQYSLDLFIHIVDGREIPVRLISMPVEYDPTLCQVTLLDIGNQPHNIKVLSQLAYYDQLTGLPNRLLFNDRLRWAIRDARRRNEKLAVMVIDLDNFKTVNDTMGHDAGDLLLKTIAARMAGCLREADTLSRMGGDEFTILMQHVTDSQDIGTAVDRLLEVIRQPIEIQERPVVISGSIGISLYPADGDNAEILTHNADIAMYRSKANGRNCVAFFNNDMRAALSRQSDQELICGKP